MRRRLTGLVAFALLLPVLEARAQNLRIGIVDFYRLQRVSAADARAVLTFKEGDTFDISGDGPPPAVRESERRLSLLPGVLRAHVNIVCCDGGGAIAYVGVVEQDSPSLQFRRPPRGGVRLGDDLVRAGRDFSEASMAAVQRGDAADDTSNGHSLMHDPAARRIQEIFIGYARDPAPLRNVLRNSSDADHRALAAQILGYA